MPLLPLWDFVACSGVNFTFTFTFIIIIIIIIRGGCVNIFVVTSALAPSTPGQNSGYFRSSIFSSDINTGKGNSFQMSPNTVLLIGNAFCYEII